MYSMTGYGKGVSKRDGKTITIEIKTVNHRFLDCNIKLPRNFLFVEDRVKKAVSSALSRGHVDLYLTYEQTSTDEGAYTVDLDLANNYLAAVKKLGEGTGLENDVTLSTLLRVGDIVTRQQAVEDEDLLAEMTLEAVGTALENLKVMREREGQSQKADIACKLDTIEDCLGRIKQFAPKVVEDYRALLDARIAKSCSRRSLTSNALQPKSPCLQITAQSTKRSLAFRLISSICARFSRQTNPSEERWIFSFKSSIAKPIRSARKPTICESPKKFLP